MYPECQCLLLSKSVRLEFFSAFFYVLKIFNEDKMKQSISRGLKTSQSPLGNSFPETKQATSNDRK